MNAQYLVSKCAGKLSAQELAAGEARLRASLSATEARRRRLSEGRPPDALLSQAPYSQAPTPGASLSLFRSDSGSGSGSAGGGGRGGGGGGVFRRSTASPSPAKALSRSGPRRAREVVAASPYPTSTSTSTSQAAALAAASELSALSQVNEAGLDVFFHLHVLTSMYVQMN
jgi:hypothetical protein